MKKRYFELFKTISGILNQNRTLLIRKVKKPHVSKKDLVLDVFDVVLVLLLLTLNMLNTFSFYFLSLVFLWLTFSTYLFAGDSPFSFSISIRPGRVESYCSALKKVAYIPRIICFI